MSAEAEKVINLSLCKMAESRGIRRGGSSLHKHLLIASVLTKARSAYFENWYLGDNDCASVNTSDALPLTESSGTTGTDDQLGLSHILDPSFFVEVEAEIELPSDILNCVEKLGDMSDMHLGFTVANRVDLNSRIQDEEDMLSEADEDDQVTSTTSDMIQGDGESGKTRTEGEITYTYLDLDSSKEVPRSPPTSVPVSANSLPSLFSSISSNPISSQSTSKRRRGWNFDQEDDSDDEDEQVEVPCSSSPELQDKLKLNGRGARHVAKRLRSSSSTNNATNSTTEVFSSTTTTTSLPVPSFNFDGNHFRTKKAHFEVDEEENSTEAANSDAFTDDDDDDSWIRSGKSSEHNDRRVPSASSSCSSDEEQDTGSCSMEVDQITNLVQYFSFQKQQHGNTATSTPTGTATNNKALSPPQSQSQLSNLSRSMSSPDLCGRSSSGSSNSSSGNSISCPKTKDLFSSYGLTNSHRILTMKV